MNQQFHWKKQKNYWIYNLLEQIDMKLEFYCVTTKHQAAEKIWQKLSCLTSEHEFKFWQDKSIALKKKKQELMNKHKSAQIAN